MNALEYFVGSGTPNRRRSWCTFMFDVDWARVGCLCAILLLTHPPRLSGFDRDAQPWRVFYVCNSGKYLNREKQKSPGNSPGLLSRPGEAQSMSHTLAVISGACNIDMDSSLRTMKLGQ